MILPICNVFIISGDMVRSDHDSLVHDGGGANLIYDSQLFSINWRLLIANYNCSRV